MQDEVEDIGFYGDLPCTICGDTGIVHRTERLCTCASGAMLEIDRDNSATDLAKAIERVRALKFGTVPSGADLSAIDMICDAGECASRVSVEDVARIISKDRHGTELHFGFYIDAAAAVMALLRGEG